MNFEALNHLARTHRDELLRDAAVRRSLAPAGASRPVVRNWLGRALRTLGTLAVSLGDALAERP